MYKALFSLGLLPDICFVSGNGSSQTFRPAQAHARITTVATFLRGILPADAAIGLMFKSEPNLIINWLACIAAGLRPLILQYPNKKQNRSYREDSVKNTIGLVSLKAIIVDDEANGARFQDAIMVLSQEELDTLNEHPRGPLSFENFTILQLSSGTTGYRKAIAFHSRDLRRHIDDFNQALKLSALDVVVSWLPLYHDMGFIGCFVMPLALGVKIVMIDPVTWVETPSLLYSAIAEHYGSICYMPNFGYEIMSRQQAPQMARMRAWIACSEPVSAKTAFKFLESSHSAVDSFVPCYAMAENIFAISMAAGIRTKTFNGADVVSCGVPIAGVDVKIIDQQVWVKSPVSIKSYIGSDDIQNAEGFYPTGDLGVLDDDGLYITGRARDVLIQAGRKFMLSDVDLRTNEILPEVRGRAACIALVDRRIETEIACNLIEAPDFFPPKRYR